MALSIPLQDILHITNEDMFGALWERSADALALSDALGIVIAANTAYYDLYGYTPQQVIGHSFALIYPPEQRAHAEARYREVFTSPSLPGRIEAVVRCADGTDRIVEARVECITQGGIRVAMLSIIRDISDQKRIAQSLLTSEERLRLAMAAADVGIWDFDPVTRVLSWDERCKALFGLAATAPVSYELFLQRLHPADRERIDASVSYVLQPASGGNYDSEYRIVNEQDGTERWVSARGKALYDETGQASRFIGTVLDITERKRTAYRLMRLQQVTSAFTAALTPQQVATIILDQGITAVEAVAGVIVTVAEDNCTLIVVQTMGYPATMEDHWRRFPLDAPVPLAEAVRTGQRILFATFADAVAQYPALEGHEVFSGALITLPLCAGERIIGAVGFSFAGAQSFNEWDIEYLDNMALQCAQALERARLFVSEQDARTAAQEAVRARDVFFSVASHELKNPLTALLGNAQLLERRTQQSAMLAERDRRALHTIVEQAGRLHAMIEAMLDVSRLETGQLSIQPRLLDLVDLVRRAVDEIETTLAAHSLVFEPLLEELWLPGDAMRLTQVLHNLISNALKYSYANACVVVRVERLEFVARLSVIDSGIGIAAAEMPHLFKRFYRVANAGGNAVQGIGVGLYVVKEIVSLHGGRIEVVSEPEQGSTFVVLLPLDSDSPLSS